jgi:opacity protein-like surface antigen
MNKAAQLCLLAGCGLLYAAIPWAQTTPDSASETRSQAESASDTIESLRKQLAAQQAINQQLRSRLQRVEQQLAASAQGVTPMVALDVQAARPAIEFESANTAIEQAMISKGLVLLPAGTYHLTPSLTWSHSGSGDQRRDAYARGLGLEAGLPGGMAASLSVPYVQRDYSDGRNSGLGDVSVTLSKELSRETRHQPSWVAHLTYLADNGKDAFAAVPVGNGFKTLTASLSAVKRVDPLVLYGTMSYGHGWSKSTTYLDGAEYRMGRITPADTYGLGVGVSLAATPEITLDAGLSFDFRGRGKMAPLDGEATRTARSSAGYIHLGAGFLLSKDLFLNLSAASGVTDGATDFILSVELPYHF